MPNPYLSWRAIQLIINGVRISEFSSDARPVEFPSIPLYEIEFGKDGGTYGMHTARRGGPVMIRLSPTSPNTADFMRWAAEIANGNHIDFEGSFIDQEHNFSTLMIGGVLEECPASVEPGQTFEVKMNFAALERQYDAARMNEQGVDTSFIGESTFAEDDADGSGII